MDDVDALVIPQIDMASIACGGHAGNDKSMLRTIAMCQQYNTLIGAHPSYPDRKNFGRRHMNIEACQLEASLSTQLAKILEHCHSLNAKLAYVKPHGALYNDVLTHPDRFETLLRTMKKNVPELPLVVLATTQNKKYMDIADAEGIQLWFEAFADRRYADDGSLVSRRHQHALLTETDLIAEQAFSIAHHHQATSENGKKIVIHAHCLCIHSDSPNAVNAIGAIRKRLTI